MQKKIFNVICNNKKESLIIKKQILCFLKKNNFVLSPTGQNIIVIGGDGTFIRTFDKYYNKDVKIALINTGNIGFYSEFINDYQQLIDLFVSDKNFISPNIIQCKNSNNVHVGINEISIQSLKTITMDIFLNKVFVQQLKSSGICLSSAIGSTGLNKSLNGCILLNNWDNWILSNIACNYNANNLSLFNSILLSKNDSLEIKILSNNDDFLIVDGINKKINKINKQLIFKLSQSKAKILFNTSQSSLLRKIKRIFIKQNNNQGV